MEKKKEKINKQGIFSKKEDSVAYESMANIVEEPLKTKAVVDLRVVQNDLVRLMAKKNHDYGNAFNQGCDALGSSYAISRLWDKCSRFMALVKNKDQAVKDESILDTISDLANYCTMYLAWNNNKTLRK